MERISEERTATPGIAGDPGAIPDPAGLAAALERVRACALGWIDRIERHLQESDRGQDSTEEVERAFQLLQDGRESLRLEEERREREWEVRLEAIEHDRRLLAEAWERLEREQLALAAPARASHEAARADRAYEAPRVARPSAAPEAAVDQAVLRQFEALRQDVRRKGETERIR